MFFFLISQHSIR